MFILTDIHTHDLVYLNVYSLTISTLNIGYFSKYHRLLFSLMVPDEMGSKPGFDSFMFQSCIAVMNWNFLCKLALNELNVTYIITAIMDNINK